jgi:[FeFe] hydrogenase H-cluster maturation GTPase HydF
MTRATPRGFRLHIGLFGRRNVGKSSLLNAITRQQVSIVSDQPGTTTDPVEKPMELLPLGPVVFIDTAGIDDAGAVGALRIARSRRILERIDLGVIVTDTVWGEFEESIRAALAERSTPVIAVFNKQDVAKPPAALLAQLAAEGLPIVRTAAARAEGILDFRQALLEQAPADLRGSQTIVADLVGPGGLAVLVVPIDKEAPKGRLILPQVQSIRDLLDACCLSLVVKDQQLRAALARLQSPPQLVVTDSQAFQQVAAEVPPAVPLTSFSILFARLKGDLVLQTQGTLAIDALRPADRVLVAEACTHHPIADDIGRVKIPRWLSERAGGPLAFDTVQGHDFPADLSAYRLVVHCGGCMYNRREMLSRLLRCRRAGVSVTNYGLAIAHCLNILERALAPFPAALAVYRQGRAA